MESISTIAGVLIATSLIFLYHFLSFVCSKMLFSNHQKPKSPPKAGGAWPIIGHVQLMGDGTATQQLPHIILGSMADTYGPIFTVRYGAHNALVVSNWELVKELFTTHNVSVTSRPRTRAGLLLGYNDVMFGFSPYGPYWTEIRKVISMGMLSSRMVELQKDLCVSETRVSINELYRVWDEKKDRSGRVHVELKQVFGDLSLNLIFLMVVGKRFFGVGGAGEDSKRCREVVNEFFRLTGTVVAADALPWLGWLDIGGHEKRMKKIASEFDGLVSKWLDDHRRESKHHPDKRNDFMDVLISAVEEDAATNLKDHNDPDTVIKSTCANLIAGGTDTISVMVVWALSLLLNNRSALQMAQQEIDIQVGKDRLVNESDIDNLVYLHAIIKETLRLQPSGALGGVREFTKDCTIGGYHVPRGTWLFINMWKLHRDPDMFPDDPLKFRPERFITSHRNVNVKGQNFELIPFGAGRRICPGMNFAIQTMLLELASFLQAFEITTPGDELVDMTCTAGVTNGKATPLDVLLVPRLSPSLYK